ncbi:flagellin [Halopenitus salinus]|jgi:flagellar protein FlaF|uniref:Flagellin n=1 Tax=Halopenitus salinus TaxID=1198295 RepID=A0ABD5UT35_9EURY
MGVSVSASTAIIVAGLFVAFGTLYPVASNGFDRVSDAGSEVNERALERENTDVEFVNATYDGSTLNVTVENGGARTVSVPRTSLVVDNEYVTTSDEETIVYDPETTDPANGSTSTELWLPEERLRFSVPADDPETALVATEEGLQVRGTVVAA